MMGKYSILECSTSIDLDDFDYKLNVYWEEDETCQFYATFELDKLEGIIRMNPSKSSLEIPIRGGLQGDKSYGPSPLNNIWLMQ